MARAAQAKAPNSGGRMWLLGMASGIAAVFAGPMALAIAVLLLPTIITWLSESGPARPVARIVFVAGAAMALGPLTHMWSTGGNWGAAMETLGDLRITAAAWAAQGAAWFTAELAPVVVRSVLDVAAAASIARTRLTRDRLAKEWDAPPPA